MMNGVQFIQHMPPTYVTCALSRDLIVYTAPSPCHPLLTTTTSDQEVTRPSSVGGMGSGDGAAFFHHQVFLFQPSGDYDIKNGVPIIHKNKLKMD